MAKGLCYYCDQLFDQGHKCETKAKQLFLVEVMGEEDDDMSIEDFTKKVEFDEAEIILQISMNAMNGSTGFHTMRVNGHVGKRTLHILVDSGSTHNFLDETFAKRLGCRLESVAA